jgi:hypothetical protein
MFSDDWMRENGFMPAPGLTYFVSDLFKRKVANSRIPEMIVLRPTDTIQKQLT